MPEGIIVDGQRVLTAGVYVENRYSELASDAAGQGVVAIVGDFPFLKQNTPYVSTSKLALEQLIAPNEPDIMRISRVCYRPSRNPALAAGAPAAVVLISPAATTQANGALPTVGATDPSIDSTIWGPRGNSTYFSMTYRPTIPGFRVDLTNRGFTERIEANQEDRVLAVAYNYVPPASMQANTVYGFGSANGGSGLLQLSKASDTISVSFERTVPAASVISSTHESWIPDGPVDGVITATVTAGSAISGLGTKISVKVVGFDQDGLPQTEIFDVNEPYTGDVTVTGAVDFSSVTAVFLYPDAGTFTGTVILSGDSLQLNEAGGATYVSDAITKISTAKGFLTATNSTRVTKIPVAKLDSKVATNITNSLATTTYLDAGLWSLETAVNEQSLLVDITIAAGEYHAPVDRWDVAEPYVEGDVVRYDDIWYTCILANTGEQPDDVGSLYWEVYTQSGTSLFDIVLGGGAHTPALVAEWEAAFNELLYSNIHAVVPFSTDDDVIAYLAQHVDKAFGKYQNERTGFYGVQGLLGYTALSQKAAKHNTERLQRVFERPQIVQYNGRTETQETYWAALALAAAANANRRRSLDRWQPDFVDVVRDSTIASPEFNDSLIDLGYCTYYRWPNQPTRLLLETTTWLGDNNTYRTAAAAVRSTVDLQRDIRATAEAIVESADVIDGIASALVAGIAQRLDQLRYDGVISDYNRGSITVKEYSNFYEVGFDYTPNGSKSYVKIIATVARPATVA